MQQSLVMFDENIAKLTRTSVYKSGPTYPIRFHGRKNGKTSALANKWHLRTQWRRFIKLKDDMNSAIL